MACFGAEAQAPQNEPPPQADAATPPSEASGPAADALGSPAGEPDEPGPRPPNEATKEGAPGQPRDVPDSPACSPPCRRGFVCREGECVSACNPPCGPDEVCTDQRTCEARRPPPVPQAYDSEVPPPPARASDPSGKHNHDGFFLRLALGFGGASVGQQSVPSVGDITFSGFSGFFSVDLGGAVADSFIIQGRVSAMALVDPNVSVDGEELGETMDTSLSISLLGVGATYYIMPVNIYFTGIIGISNARLETSGITGESDTGFGLELDIGKEWWVSDNWGLGVAGRFQFARAPDSGDSGDDFPITGFAGGVLFSVTYN